MYKLDEFMSELCKKSKISEIDNNTVEFSIHDFSSLNYGEENTEKAFKFVLDVMDKNDLIYVNGAQRFGLTDKGKQYCNKYGKL
jgi:hypothetical protein